MDNKQKGNPMKKLIAALIAIEIGVCPYPICKDVVSKCEIEEAETVITAEVALRQMP